MCDADSYATGLLLTQISVGLLTSVLINSAAKSIHEPLPTARAVPVSGADYGEFEEEEEEEEETQLAVPAVATPIAAERVGQTLRRRAIEHTRTKESVTIKVNGNLAENMKFDF